ncbi:long-chain-fatty-acid-CoA ligase [Thraustotheca clavata]|uniref:Long-chain-fatty-acid-CoA ligase n=1 Tax=Thraustotheca clavata TaxID=74557 RepID=A0A1W0A5J7_9STRA|nr:long-chain-fatty-acid-CoA ligase [Thraustotheca clavata]
MQSPTYVTSRLSQAVTIRPNTSRLPTEKLPQSTTLISLFQRTVKRYGYQKALHEKRKEKWYSITWRQYYAQAQEFTKSLIRIGLQPHEVVGICGANTSEWLIAYMGTIMAGGTSTGIYTNLSGDLCQYIIGHSEARIIVCDSVASLERFIAMKPYLPRLMALVLWGKRVPMHLRSPIPIYGWDSFIVLGDDITKGTLKRRMDSVQPGHCACLIYTSGTTGLPKGVMISHDNFWFNAWCTDKSIDRDYNTRLSNRDVLVSYLPLAHVTAQLNDIILPIVIGYEIHFAARDAMHGSLGKTLKEVRPTRFCGVPFIWDKMAIKMRDLQGKSHGLKQQLVNFATSRAIKKTRISQYGQHGGAPCGVGIAEKLVLSRVKASLGLDRCKTFSVTSAPLRTETLDFYGGLNIPIMEFFGQTETGGLATLNLNHCWKMGTVGRPLLGTEMRIKKETHELMVRGRHVMMGYYKREPETIEVIDDDGWLHSGDTAIVDEDGFCTITGSIPETIRTTGGERISPVQLENILVAEIPLLSHVMVIGEQREFLLALFTLKVIQDEEGRPTQMLEDNVREMCRVLGSVAQTVDDAKRCSKVQSYLDERLADVNKQTSQLFSFGHYIAKYAILDTEFSVLGDELTPTLKLKRSRILEKHAAVIESIYDM